MLNKMLRLSNALMIGGLCVLSSSGAAQFSYSQFYIDTEYGAKGVGWVRAGDMDGDGDLDIVAGGGRALFVYENAGKARGWTRYGNLDSTKAMGANGGVLYDVDGDRDLDVVSALYKNELGWWENDGVPLRNTAWTFHPLADGVEDWFLHDMVVGDLDEDDETREIVVVLQKGYWDAPFQVHWYRPGPDPTQKWEKHVVTNKHKGSNNNHAGVDLGDLDGDGDIDISFSNGWFESTKDEFGSWIWRRVTDIYGVSNSLIRDMDDDEGQDLVISAGHHGRGVYWLEAPTDPKGGKWVRHTIDADVIHPEGLQVTDLDGDGDLDVLAPELFFGVTSKSEWHKEMHNLYIYENLGGNSHQWKKHNIAPNSFPSHLPSMVDINEDGYLDIISESAGAPIISYYENRNQSRKKQLDSLR